jgi:hypothetical protein
MEVADVRKAMAWLATVAVLALGLAGGIVLVLNHPGQSTPLWALWAPLAVAVSTSAAAVLVYGIRRWFELNTLLKQPRPQLRVRVRSVAIPVAVFATVAVLIINVPRFLPERTDAHATWQNGLLVSLVVLAGIPAWGVMYGVWHVAAIGPLPEAPGEKVVVLKGLRRLLLRLLAVAGAVVALVTFQFGTLMMLERNEGMPLGDLPPQYALVFGGVGSLLVAVAYVPGWAALQRRGRELCQQLFPIGDRNDGPAILSWASDLKKMEQLLGVDRSIMADLKNGLAILAPLLAGAAATLLPH